MSPSLPQMHQYSRGEMLAATQAMSVYTVMRMIDYGRDYFVMNRDMINTMAVRQLFNAPGIGSSQWCLLPLTAKRITEARSSFRSTLPRAREPAPPTGSPTYMGRMDPRRDS